MSRQILVVDRLDRAKDIFHAEQIFVTSEPADGLPKRWGRSRVAGLTDFLMPGRMRMAGVAIVWGPAKTVTVDVVPDPTVLIVVTGAPSESDLAKVDAQSEGARAQGRDVIVLSGAEGWAYDIEVRDDGTVVRELAKPKKKKPAPISPPEVIAPIPDEV